MCGGWRGQPDGSTIGEVHGPVFPAFVGHALLVSGTDQPLGYPNDYAARAAFQVIALYALLAAVALAGVIRAPESGAIAVVLLMQVPVFYRIYYDLTYSHGIPAGPPDELTESCERGETPMPA